MFYQCIVIILLITSLSICLDTLRSSDQEIPSTERLQYLKSEEPICNFEMLRNTELEGIFIG